MGHEIGPCTITYEQVLFLFPMPFMKGWGIATGFPQRNDAATAANAGSAAIILLLHVCSSVLHWPSRNSCLITHTHTHTHRATKPVSASAPKPVSWKGFKIRYSLNSLWMDSYFCHRFPICFGGVQCSWFSQIAQGPSAAVVHAEDRRVATRQMILFRPLGRALSWKDLFSLEVGSAFPAII